jgi:hypothetical protein
MYQKLRYERVKAAQLKGEEIRNKWHQADWAKVRQDPSLIRLPRDDWLHAHDCERYFRRIWSRAVTEHYGGGPQLPSSALACGPNSDELRPLPAPNSVL